MYGGGCELGSVPLPNVTQLFAALNDFHGAYGAIHPYLALVLCVVGTAMNISTIAVLTRPSMISPVNVLLCAVAVCDITVMSSYFIFVCHFLIAAAERCDPRDYSYNWAVFTLVHAHSSVIFHAASIWMTVLLAQIRVLTIKRATTAPSLLVTAQFTAGLSIGAWVVVTLFNLPNFLTFEIVSGPAALFFGCLMPEDDLHLVFNMTTNELLPYSPAHDNYSALIGEPVAAVRAIESNCGLLKWTFWSNGMLFKVIPCLLLSVSIGVLLKLIDDVGQRRRSLAQVMKKKRLPKDHTTPMLVAVLSIFLLAELPQGVMLVLTGIYSSDEFHHKVYLMLGDLMDLLSLVNSSVNFLIYCAMSRKFRLVFIQTFIRCYQPLDDGSPQPVNDLTRPHLTKVTDLQPRTGDHRPSINSAAPSPRGSNYDLRLPPLFSDGNTAVTALLSPSDGVRPRSATVELRPIKPLGEREPMYRTRLSQDISAAHSEVNGCTPLTQSPERRMTLMRIEATNGDVF